MPACLLSFSMVSWALAFVFVTLDIDPNDLMIGSVSFCSRNGLTSRLICFSARKMSIVSNPNSSPYESTEVRGGSDSGLCFSIKSNHGLQFCQWQQQTEQSLWGDASFKPHVKALACKPDLDHQDPEAEGFSHIWGHPLPQSEILSRVRCVREVGWRGRWVEGRRGGGCCMRWKWDKVGRDIYCD